MRGGHEVGVEAGAAEGKGLKERGRRTLRKVKKEGGTTLRSK